MFTDRLREMKYISNSGNEFTLQFEGLTRTGGKKAPISEYPGQNQGGVQDLGNVTPTFPVNCFITGANYDKTADSFWQALHETGIGRLIHPRWGNVNVLPIPNTQTEQFVNGAGRAVFDITFIRADNKSFEYPQVSTDFASTVTSKVDDAAETIADSVPEEVSAVGVLATLTEKVSSSVDEIEDGFDTITDMTDDVKESISEKVLAITSEIDDLVTSPVDLLISITELVRLPATISTDIINKIDSYTKIYENVIDGLISAVELYAGETDSDGNSIAEATGQIAVATVTAVAIAAAESTTAGDINTRDDAAEVVESLTELAESIQASIEELESAGDFSASYDLSLTLELTISAAVSGLIDEALNLPAERTITLERAVPPTVLYYELFGNLDDLDDWMTYNNFCDNEILLIPRGREVRWYVE
ncbi:MAG: DNA circularization N-terminal domain-containing protein [Spirochaetales bacterium]|nr:DNA circularization N-terminal domain-containing protein [Spirochaetales bacterium]